MPFWQQVSVLCHEICRILILNLLSFYSRSILPAPAYNTTRSRSSHWLWCIWCRVVCDRSPEWQPRCLEETTKCVPEFGVVETRLSRTKNVVLLQAREHLVGPRHPTTATLGLFPRDLCDNRATSVRSP